MAVLADNKTVMIAFRPDTDSMCPGGERFVPSHHPPTSISFLLAFVSLSLARSLPPFPFSLSPLPLPIDQREQAWRGRSCARVDTSREGCAHGSQFAASHNKRRSLAAGSLCRLQGPCRTSSTTRQATAQQRVFAACSCSRLAQARPPSRARSPRHTVPRSRAGACHVQETIPAATATTA